MNLRNTYKNYSNTGLIKVIDSPANYRPEAVAAAREILAERQLSPEETVAARAAATLQIEKEANSSTKVSKKIATIEASVKDAFVTDYSQGTAARNMILFVIISMWIYVALQVYFQYGRLYFMFTDSMAIWGFSMVVSFLPLILLPIGNILFYKRHKAGWILLTLFSAYNIMLTVVTFVMILKLEHYDVVRTIATLPGYAIVVYFVALLCILLVKDVRSAFRITERDIYYSIGGAAGLTAFFAALFM